MSLSKAAADSRTDAFRSSPQPSGKRAFSPEIHGVRGLALTMVVAFHLFGQGRVSGGVDVFLVVSAYLITGSLLRAIASNRLSLIQRYGRTFSRLLPAALLTITATALTAMVVLPRSRWSAIFEQVKATALFMENRYLATTGLSYAAAGDGASPFQHFWSLSIQGQFLIFWPATAFTLIVLGRKLSAPTKRLLFGLFTVGIAAISFVYAIKMVGIDQPVAYYSLPARLWEFALGSLAAFFASRAPRLGKWAGWAGWLGIAIILSSGFVIDGAQTFPGPWALWPVTGAMLVLLAADSGAARDTGFTQALSWTPIVWLANRGYPLYLWHWPILVFYLESSDQQQVTFLEALGILALSFAFTELTSRFVSQPAARQANLLQATTRGARLLFFVLLASALAVAAIGYAGVRNEDLRTKRELERAATYELPEEGQKSFNQGFPTTDPDSPLVPAVDVAQQDLPDIYALGCVQNWRDGTEYEKVLVCADDPGEGAKTVEEPKRVVMTGGSHVIQFYPALRQIADEEGWELIVIDKDGCRLATDGPESTRKQACIEWNKNAIDVIVAENPDAVITLGTTTSTSADESVSEDQVAAWEALTNQGVPVIVFRDSPRFEKRVPECLETAADAAECGADPSQLYAEASPLTTTELPNLVYPIDFVYAMCDAESCPALVGNVVAYRDASHVTATFAKTLAPAIRAELEAAFPELFS